MAGNLAVGYVHELSLTFGLIQRSTETSFKFNEHSAGQAEIMYAWPINTLSRCTECRIVHGTDNFNLPSFSLQVFFPLHKCHLCCQTRSQNPWFQLKLKIPFKVQNIVEGINRCHSTWACNRKGQRNVYGIQSSLAESILRQIRSNLSCPCTLILLTVSVKSFYLLRHKHWSALLRASTSFEATGAPPGRARALRALNKLHSP